MLDNAAKSPAFTSQEREDMLRQVTAGIENVEVYSFSGLLVDFMKRFDLAVIIKGVRTVSDFEYEFQMALLNKSLDPGGRNLFYDDRLEIFVYQLQHGKRGRKMGGSIDEFGSM